MLSFVNWVAVPQEQQPMNLGAIPLLYKTTLSHTGIVSGWVALQLGHVYSLCF